MRQGETPESLKFQRWELRPIERALLVDGQRVKVGGRAFDLLHVLATRAGAAVTKDELLEVAWRGLVVEENNLTVQITALRKLLGAEAIVTVPGRGYRLAAAPLAAAPGVRAQAALPQARPLVGREQELADLAVLLGQDPLLTIIGTGGVGKTSLARAAIDDVGDRWRDGVHWIDLAPLREPSQIAAKVTQSLGVTLNGLERAREEFAAAFAGLSALVVLDNCEHLPEAVVAFLTEARSVAPSVCWLATSQQPLRLADERVYRLEPLVLPRSGAPRAEAELSAAMRLFVERARAADRHFSLDSDHFDTAIDICRQLDGLPLSLEMAAARVAAFGLQGVQRQLGSRMQLLSGRRAGPERHHSLEQTFEWSYGLLSPLEQGVFRRLEPFLGGCDTEMILAMNDGRGGGLEAVDPLDTVAAIGALVDKSLLQRVPGMADRFQLYESARAYARLQLERTGEREAVHARHAQIMAARCRDFDSQLNRLRDADWLALYAPERPNLRAALVWAISAGNPDLLARLTGALICVDALTESPVEVLREPLPEALIEQAAPVERARALLYLGWAHYAEGSRRRASELIQRALHDHESLQDHAGIYRSLMLLLRLHESRPGMTDDASAVLERLQGLDTRSLPLRVRLTGAITAGLANQGDTIAKLTDVQRLARSAGFDELVAMCCALLTDALLVQDRYEDVIAAAETYLAEGGRRSRSLALICHNQALALVRLGRAHEAVEPAKTVLRALPSMAHMLTDLFALAAAKQQHWPEAALLAGYGAQVRSIRDLRSDAAEAAAIRDTHALLAAALPPERLEDLLRTGASLAIREALALALATTD